LAHFQEPIGRARISSGKCQLAFEFKKSNSNEQTSHHSGVSSEETLKLEHLKKNNNSKMILSSKDVSVI